MSCALHPIDVSRGNESSKGANRSPFVHSGPTRLDSIDSSRSPSPLLHSNHPTPPSPPVPIAMTDGGSGSGSSSSPALHITSPRRTNSSADEPERRSFFGTLRDKLRHKEVRNTHTRRQQLDSREEVVTL